MRACTKCNIIKPLSEYYPGKGYADGYKRICKECHRIMSDRTKDPKDFYTSEELGRLEYILAKIE
jgi:RNA polymerase subunit RPABC4/transcription elongation factor Spt4